MPIIASPALVITPAFVFPAHHPLVGWRNQVAFDNIAADSENASYPVTNLANPSTFLRWQGASAAEILITISDVDGETDYVGIARHNFATAGIEVSVEAITAEPGAVWEEVFPGALLATDAPTMLLFEAGNYIGVRLRLQAGAATPQAAVLYVGLSQQLPQGLQPGYTPLHDGQQIEILKGRSERGEHLGTIITGKDLGSVADIRVIRPADYDDHMREFVDAANLGLPFFFAWDPDGHPADVAFCWLSETAQPVYVTHNRLMAITLPMGGLAL